MVDGAPSPAVQATSRCSPGAVGPGAPHAPKLAQSIKSWAEKRAELERGELDEDAYADWKASF